MVSNVVMEMIQYLGHDVKQVEHALKVFAYATTIAEREGLCGGRMMALQSAALLHDIAVPQVLDDTGYAPGHLQESLGAPIARDIMIAAGLGALAERVHYLVGHHHTYTEEMEENEDLQILIEADHLVNVSEGHVHAPLEEVMNRFFSTHAGKELMTTLYL